MPDIPNSNAIVQFFHCARCLSDKPNDTSMRDFARFEIGWTEIGFQVWFLRHGVNAVHVDFEGQQHPANTTAHSGPTVVH